LKLLTISSLYPNNKDPKHGIFIETRLRNLTADYTDVKATVIAPVPWFPFSSPLFGEYARFSGVKSTEIRNNIEIHHPRYLVLPKVGMYLTPILMAWTITRAIKKLIKQGEAFDLIDGHYFFPDGVAIAKAAENAGLPFTCTARGTDINLIPQQEKARLMIQKVFKKASHTMAVCQALKDEMIAIGAKEKKVTVLRNGVDLELFKPSKEIERDQLKASLAIEKKLVMSVGWLIERKGHYLIIEAIKELDNVVLAIAGDGPDRKKLETLVAKHNLKERVLFLGSLAQVELNNWFRAADVTVLASSREGWANVLLESMASGTAVVASKVWGTPEVVAAPEAGVLVERTADGIKKGITTLLENPPNRETTRIYAEQFDWLSTSKGQYDIFKGIIS